MLTIFLYCMHATLTWDPKVIGIGIGFMYTLLV